MRHFTFRDSVRSEKFTYFAPALGALIERLAGMQRCLETCQEAYTTDIDIVELSFLRVHAESVLAAYLKALETLEHGLAYRLRLIGVDRLPAFGECMVSKTFAPLFATVQDSEGGPKDE
jgi:hypothetical protein